MTMTKKDYELIAKALKRRKPESGLSSERWQWEHDVVSLTLALEEDNPRFDRTRFQEACGIG